MKMAMGIDMDGMSVEPRVTEVEKKKEKRDISGLSMIERLRPGRV